MGPPILCRTFAAILLTLTELSVFWGSFLEVTKFYLHLFCPVTSIPVLISAGALSLPSCKITSTLEIYPVCPGSLFLTSLHLSAQWQKNETATEICEKRSKLMRSSGSPAGGDGIETQFPEQIVKSMSRGPGEHLDHGQDHGSRAGVPGPHHLIGHGVLVGLVQVALAIMGLHQAPQFSVQRNVGHVVRSEHQQMQCILSPADLFLKDRSLMGAKHFLTAAHACPRTLDRALAPLPGSWSESEAFPYRHSWGTLIETRGRIPQS